MGSWSFIGLAICWRPVVALLTIYTFLLCSSSNTAESYSCNGGCMNGGRKLLPNSMFGRCSCKCPAPFSGPKCQFVIQKRSQSLSETADVPDLSSLLLARSKVQAMDSPANQIESNDDWFNIWAKLRNLQALDLGQFGEEDDLA